MSDNNKMREAMTAATKIVTNPHGYTETSVLVAKAFLEQAAQSVPVVGEPVAWAVPVATQTGQPDTKLSWTESGARIGVKVGESTPLYLKPANSISAAELERLRKDAERGRLLINRGEWLRFDHDTPDAYALLAVRLPYTTDLSCKAMREDAIDAAIAAEENSHD